MLNGRKVLVVEDEPMIAMLIEDMLIDLGCTVIGPAMGLAEGLELADTPELDAAVLDVNLNGQRSYGLADALATRGIPVLFATGYGGGEELHERSEPVLQKPYQIDRLEAALIRMIQQA